MLDLQERLNFRQGNLTLTSYLTSLKTLLDELDILKQTTQFEFWIEPCPSLSKE